MHILTLLARYALFTAWMIIQQIVSLLQSVRWVLNGTADELMQSRRKTNYDRSAQVLHIVFRFKLDEYLSPAKLSDFMLSHERMESPTYVLQHHITLYQVTDKEAIFIEARPGEELWRAKNYTPFLMTSQFKHGIKVIRLPIDSLYCLADQLGDPKGQLIFLTNTARCGSTLLTQMLEVTDKIVAISEPSALNVLTRVVEKNTHQAKQKQEVDLHRRIVATVRILCKPTSIDNELAHVIKLTAPAMQRLAVLSNLFPKSKSLFMYRDSLKVAQSLYRLSEELPALKTVFVLGIGSELRLGLCVLAMGMPKDDYKFTLHHPLSVGTMLWVASVKKYLEFLEQGLNIAAVRYEDLVEQPVSALQGILRFCDLPISLAEQAKEALEWDSQKNTPLANSVLRKHATLEYSGDAKIESDDICDKMGATHLGEVYIAPKTITADHKN